MTKYEFWNQLTEENKERAEVICKGYAGSDGTIGRIFEMYQESINNNDGEYMDPNTYVELYWDTYEE